MNKGIYCPSCSIGIDYQQMKKRKCNNCLHEWDIYHVTPVNDSQVHFESYQCKCNPEVRNEGENMVVIHNSFDGREGVEWFNEIINHE
jgi:uncharacterized Zn ribbon protein